MQLSNRAWVLFAFLLATTLIGAFILKAPGPIPAPPNDVGATCSGVCASNSSLVCKVDKCELCVTDIDCHHHHPDFFCEDSLCKHKPLVPMNSVDWGTIILVALTVAVASGGGIGGGGILVALFILIEHFSAHSAIPLSKATIFGGAVYNFIYFVRDSHPHANRPRIDFDIALLLEPLTLAGTTVGVLCNHVFPDTLILVLLVIILGLTTWKTTLKGISTWESESQRMDGTESSHLLAGPGKRPQYSKVAPEDADEDAESVALNGAGQPQTEEDKREIEALLEVESVRLPMYKVSLLLMLWVLMLLIEIARGGTEGGLVRCGGLAYWFLFFMVFPITIALVYYVGAHLTEVHETKERIGYPWREGDTKWTDRNSKLYPCLCMIAGLIAGLLGVGGGMIKGPLLLELGVIPEVQSATTAFMVLFTASCTTMQFLIMGDLTVDYAVCFVLVGFFATAIGQNIVGWIVKKYQRSSIIIFSLALVLGVSVIMIGYTGVEGLERREKLHMSEGFRELCRR